MGAGLLLEEWCGRASGWTAARMIRVTSRSTMIPPSILASSRSPVAVNGTSRGSRRWRSTRRPCRGPGRSARRCGRGGCARDRRAAACPARWSPGSPAGGASRPSGRWPPVPSSRARRPSAAAGSLHGVEAVLRGLRRPVGAAALGLEHLESQGRADVGDVEDPHAVDGPRLRGAAWPGSVGTTATRNPSRAASASRWGRRGPGAAPRTGRSRPWRRRPSVQGTPRLAEVSAAATARSLAGSTTRAPPIVEANTSLLCRRTPQCCWSTAITIATREESRPEVVRRGRSAALWVTRPGPRRAAAGDPPC